jgi:hypothetical protein
MKKRERAVKAAEVVLAHPLVMVALHVSVLGASSAG